MSNYETKRRKRIEAQGFLGLSNAEINDLNYWFRFAPAVCLIWTAIGLLFASKLVICSLVPFAILGAVMRIHPFDLLYERVVRFYHPIRPSMPTYGLPRRFACLVAASALTLTAVAFDIGAAWVGYIFGGMMVVMASVQVVSGFCGPAIIYARLFGEPAGQLEPRP
ncbi:MAG: DUF4395 family protein [Acidobacteriota bacterium]